LRGVQAEGHTDLGAAMKTFVAQHKRGALPSCCGPDPAASARHQRRRGQGPFQSTFVPARPEARPKGDVRVYAANRVTSEVTVTAKVLDATGRLQGVPRRGASLLSRQVSTSRRRDVPDDHPARLRRGGNALEIAMTEQEPQETGVGSPNLPCPAVNSNQGTGISPNHGGHLRRDPTACRRSARGATS
jgi:hypothetical protein